MSNLEIEIETETEIELETEIEIEIERNIMCERNIYQLPPVSTLTRDLTHILGMCSDLSLNPHPFGVWDEVPTRPKLSQLFHLPDHLPSIVDFLRTKYFHFAMLSPFLRLWGQKTKGKHIKTVRHKTKIKPSSQFGFSVKPSSHFYVFLNAQTF